MMKFDQSSEKSASNIFEGTRNVKRLKDISGGTVAVYDLSGRLVRTLVEGRVCPAAPNEEVWDGRDDQGRFGSAGVYVYRLETPSFRGTRRMTLLK